MYSICIIISDRPLLFWLPVLAAFVFPFYYYFFLVKERKPLVSNPIEMKY